MSRKKIAILTPTYNRADLLPCLYQSLCEQINFDFKWYIVDDGSLDNTKVVVGEFETEKFEIEYIYKNNGGKHTACNLGFSKIEEELTFIVDSDDTLTKDAIETIVTDWRKYKDVLDIGGLSYHRMHLNGEIVGDAYVGGGYCCNLIYRYAYQ